MVVDLLSGEAVSTEHMQSKQQLQLAVDRALVERIKKKDQQAASELYDTYAPALLRRILRMLGGDMTQAEDCLQQVFVKVLFSIDAYRGEGTLHAWLNRTVTHIVMDVFRKQKKWRQVVDSWSYFWPKGWGHEANVSLPDRLFLQEETKELLHEGLTQLNQKNRMALVLYYIEGYSIEEIAEELHIPVGTAASRLYHGRRKVHTWLKRAIKERGLSTEEWLHE